MYDIFHCIYVCMHEENCEPCQYCVEQNNYENNRTYRLIRLGLGASSLTKRRVIAPST